MSGKMTTIEELSELAELAVKALAKKGATDAVAHAQLGDSRQVKFANNKLASHSTWSSAGIGLFASFDRRIVSTTVREHTKGSVEKAAAILQKLARAVEPNGEFQGLAEGPFKKGREAHYDKSLEEPGDLGVEIVEKAVEAALEEGGKRTAGVFEFETGQEFLATSAGARLGSKSSGCYFSIRALADGEASGAQSICSRTLKALPIEEAARRAGELAAMANRRARLRARGIRRNMGAASARGNTGHSWKRGLCVLC